MDPLLWPLILQLILLILTAFVYAAEKAMLSLNLAKLNEAAEEGDKRAEKLAKLADEPDKFFAGVQMLCLLTTCLAGAFSAWQLAPIATLRLFGADHAAWLDTAAVLVLVGVICWLTLMFGVLIPRRVAMEKPRQVAQIAVPPVYALSTLIRPFVWFTTLCAGGVLRIFGIRDLEMSDNATEDEIRMMLDESEEEGLIESTEGEMIDNIFEFNNIQIYDVMTHRVDVELINIEDSRDEITDLIRETGFSRFPVYEDDQDHIIGILYVKDFFLNQDTPVRELLKEAIFVPDSMICDDLFHKMQKEHIHFAIVTDEYGSFQGIITLEDLIEEIVGNIYDEYDENEEYIIPNPDGSWTIHGRAELKDVEKALDIELSERENFNTLSGLILSKTEEIPRDGAQFTVEADGLHIEVLKVVERRIEETRVSILPPEETEYDD